MKRLETMAVVAAVLTPGALVAQAPKLIDGRPSCASCDIVVEKVVRLNDPAAGINGSAGNISTIDQDSQGRFWVADYGARTHVLVFDGTGRLLKKIGGKGKGPGEFEYLGTLAVGRGDTVHAFDESNMRRSLVSPTTLSIVGATPWPRSGMNPVPLPDGSVIISTENRQFLLTAVSPKGEVVRDFAPNPRADDRVMRRWTYFRIGRGPGNDVYAVPRNVSYTIHRWSGDGKDLGAWRRQVDWFPDMEREPRFDAREGFPSEAFAIWADSTGLVYVATHRLQRGHERATTEQVIEGGRKAWVIDDRQQYWDTMIEVFDLDTSRLVASKRFDQYFDGPAGRNHLYIKGDDPEDFLDVWRVKLIRR